MENNSRTAEVKGSLSCIAVPRTFLLDNFSVVNRSRPIQSVLYTTPLGTDAKIIVIAPRPSSLTCRAPLRGCNSSI